MCEVRKEVRKNLTATLLGLMESEVIAKVAKGNLVELIECSMYEAGMRFTKGNQVQAAKVLGVARGTLRTKLKQYFGTTQVGGLYHDLPHCLGKEACNDDDIVSMSKEGIPNLLLVSRCVSDEIDCV